MGAAGQCTGVNCTLMIIVLAVYLKITDQCRDRHLVSVFQNNAPLG